MTEEATVHQWRIDTHSELMAWTLDNRYVRELTCEERAIYRLEPRVMRKAFSQPAPRT